MEGFMEGHKQKAKVYIDGANMFYTQKKLGKTLDWNKAKDYLGQRWNIVEYRYYLGVKQGDDKIKRYLEYLDRLNFTVIIKPLKVIQVNNQHPLYQLYQYKQIYKCNFDVEISTDISFDRAVIDDVILFSGDSDFHYLAKKMKSVGKGFLVFSSRKTISWELKLSASECFFIEDIPQLFKTENIIF